MPNRPLRVLSIGAHPADIFDQSGGTMAHHAARGDHVACVVLTHGARVHDNVISDSMFHREQVPIGDELLKMIAERFISLDAETHYLLPVTDYALKRARSSDHEIMAAYSHRIKVD